MFGVQAVLFVLSSPGSCGIIWTKGRLKIMDIFESLEQLQTNWDTLNKELRQLDLSKTSQIGPTVFDRQMDILNTIATNTKSLEEQAVELKRLADTAEKRAELAEKESRSAKKDARFSKVISVLALLVSAGSLAVAIIALAVG